MKKGILPVLCFLLLMIPIVLIGYSMAHPTCHQYVCKKGKEEEVREFIKECLSHTDNGHLGCTSNAAYAFSCSETWIDCQNAWDCKLVFTY